MGITCTVYPVQLPVYVFLKGVLVFYLCFHEYEDIIFDRFFLEPV